MSVKIITVIGFIITLIIGFIWGIEAFLVTYLVIICAAVLVLILGILDFVNKFK